MTHPLTAFLRLELERYGLRWAHGPFALAHPAADGSCAVLSRDLDETARSLADAIIEYQGRGFASRSAKARAG